MSHSLEVRPILLDHNLAELAFSLDDRFKVREGMLKAVFVDSVKDIIPTEVWMRKKTGFEMPFADWMNGALNSKFKEVVSNKRADSIFTEDYLRRLRMRVASRRLKRVDWLASVFLFWLGKHDIQI